MSGVRSSSAPRFSLRRAIRLSIAASLVTHAALLGVLISTKVVGYRNQRPLRTIDVPGAASGGETADVSSATPVIATPAVKPTSTSTAAGRVADRLSESIASSQQHSVAENLDKLAEMSGQLRQVSSADSLRELAAEFRGWMGLQQRAAEPVAQPASTPAEESDTPVGKDQPTFDYQTAQFHAVERQETSPGQFEYSAILIDSQGRTHTVPLSAEEGRPLYELLLRVRENPLLDQVYRQLAMPLLDKLIAKPPALNATPQQPSP